MTHRPLPRLFHRPSALLAAIALTVGAVAAPAQDLTFDGSFETDAELSAWSYRAGHGTKNGGIREGPGFASDTGGTLRWFSTDAGQGQYGMMRRDLGGDFDFSNASISVRVQRVKRSTVVGMLLFDDGKLVAEYARKLLPRNEWVGLTFQPGQSEPERTGQGSVESVDAIALFHRNPKAPGGTGKGHISVFDALAIDGVDGIRTTRLETAPEASPDATAPAPPPVESLEPMQAPLRGVASVPEILRADKLVDDPGFKYRVMVDKTRIHFNESFAESKADGDYAHYAELGFNILCPRHYYRMRPLNEQHLQLIEKAATRAGGLGMYYMQWMRGSFNARRYAPEATRFVFRDGVESKVVSPSSERFWELMEQEIMPVVEISTRRPILGMFLDFEGYGNAHGHWYPPSYDDEAWERFFADRGRQAPDIAYARRSAYLAERDLKDSFRQNQYEYWRRKARALRRKIDEENPAFQFAVYPQSWTDFINKVVWNDLATQEAPLIPAAHMTYGRGQPLKSWEDHWRLSNDQALRLDYAYLARYKNFYRRRNAAYMGGINTGGDGGGDPKLAARKAVLFARHVDGYWVWYAGIVPGSILERRFNEWWKIANRSILEGKDSVLIDMRDWNPHIASKWLDLLEADVP